MNVAAKNKTLGSQENKEMLTHEQKLKLDHDGKGAKI